MEFDEVPEAITAATTTDIIKQTEITATGPSTPYNISSILNNESSSASGSTTVTNKVEPVFSSGSIDGSLTFAGSSRSWREVVFGDNSHNDNIAVESEFGQGVDATLSGPSASNLINNLPPALVTEIITTIPNSTSAKTAKGIATGNPYSRSKRVGTKTSSGGTVEDPSERGFVSGPVKGSSNSSAPKKNDSGYGRKGAIGGKKAVVDSNTDTAEPSKVSEAKPPGKKRGWPPTLKNVLPEAPTVSDGIGIVTPMTASQNGNGISGNVVGGGTMGSELKPRKRGRPGLKVVLPHGQVVSDGIGIVTPVTAGQNGISSAGELNGDAGRGNIGSREVVNERTDFTVQLSPKKRGRPPGSASSKAKRQQIINEVVAPVTASSTGAVQTGDMGKEVKGGEGEGVEIGTPVTSSQTDASEVDGEVGVRWGLSQQQRVVEEAAEIVSSVTAGTADVAEVITLEQEVKEDGPLAPPVKTSKASKGKGGKTAKPKATRKRRRAAKKKIPKKWRNPYLYPLTNMQQLEDIQFIRAQTGRTGPSASEKGQAESRRSGVSVTKAKAGRRRKA
ncbi:hypothetical protein HDU76_001559 [Blyttiomyces sp. JEL0837]|nr:hypothetical protein HDU76_001559 [Blyttiomyces sp. JEL0837]